MLACFSRTRQNGVNSPYLPCDSVVFSRRLTVLSAVVSHRFVPSTLALPGWPNKLILSRKLICLDCPLYIGTTPSSLSSSRSSTIMTRRTPMVASRNSSSNTRRTNTCSRSNSNSSSGTAIRTRRPKQHKEDIQLSSNSNSPFRPRAALTPTNPSIWRPMMARSISIVVKPYLSRVA